MQIIFLPKRVMILSYFIVWPVMQILIAVIGNTFGDEHFDPNCFWLRPKKWERNGLIYKKVFKIHKWKHLLPDGAKVYKKGFQKKHIKNDDPVYLKAFIAETGRAETIHWVQIIPFWVFGLWSPPRVIGYMFCYAIVMNMPCIMAQRYNRPRLVRIYNNLMKKESKVA